MSGKMEIFVPEIGRKCILGRIWGLIRLIIEFKREKTAFSAWKGF
jgi:hypothetical protein